MPLVLGELHAAAPNDRWIEQSDRFARHIMTQSARVGDGVIAHAAAPDWVRTVWVDTLYYTAPVLAVAWQLTGNEDYLDEALRQCRLHAEILRDPLTGLYYHDGVPGRYPMHTLTGRVVTAGLSWPSPTPSPRPSQRAKKTHP